MSVEIRVPELGETVLEATVAQWLKKEGDPVKQGEALVELETDKVNLEVSAQRDGVLAKIERGEGEDVKVGDVLGSIDESGAAAPQQTKTPQEEKPVPQPPQAEPAAPAQPAATAPLQPDVAGKPGGGDGSREWTPVARKMATEQGIDLAQVAAQVQGSGPGGRITREDVERYIQNAPAQAPAAVPTQPQAQPAAQPAPQPAASAPGPRPENTPEQGKGAGGRGEERVKMSRRRRTIAARLVEAQQTAAMLTTFNEIDMTGVIDLRKRRGEAFQERYGVKLGFMSFFVKASIGALKAFPRLNAEIQGEEMVIKHYYDIGIAVGAEEGLVVPVLRDADRMSFATIEKTINEFVEKTRQNTLALDDLRGGTFTITNGGVFGSLLSTPILTPPQVGILGLHKIEKRPIMVADEVVGRSMMYVALSYDHRIVDGREAVQFLVRIKELIEDPEAMLLEG